MVNLESNQNIDERASLTDLDRIDVIDDESAELNNTTESKNTASTIVRRSVQFLKEYSLALLAIPLADICAIYFLVTYWNVEMYDGWLAYLVVGFMALVLDVVVLLGLWELETSYFSMYLVVSIVLILSVMLAKCNTKDIMPDA